MHRSQATARALAFACLAALLLATASGGARAEALLLIEADTGKVLHAENATYPWYPASISKLMTTYVTLRAVRQGRIKLDTLFTVSENALAQQPSKMGFPVGTQLTVDNALKMMLVKSANDMAVVLAEGVSGSIDAFAAEMNEASQRLGMTQSNWVNPNGLPDDRQITSARDMAILARTLIREFPEYDFYWHIPSIRLGKRVMRNYNRLIDRYPGADGMKTGFICASGYNLVASATRNGRRLIAVVLGASSGAARAEEAANLLEKGFTTGGGLSWFTASLGTLDGLRPIAAAPPNLREEICGAHRGRPRTDHAEEEGEPGADAAAAAYASVGGEFRPGDGKVSLLGPLTSSAPPIAVSVIPPKRAPATPEALDDKPAGDTPPVVAVVDKRKGRKTLRIDPATPPVVEVTTEKRKLDQVMAIDASVPPPKSGMADLAAKRRHAGRGRIALPPAAARPAASASDKPAAKGASARAKTGKKEGAGKAANAPLLHGKPAQAKASAAAATR